MTVALPANGVREATPRFIDRGGVLKAALGGDDQRLDRLGSKWGVSATTKPMKGEDARIWIARLIRGKREKASLAFPQPGVQVPALVGSAYLGIAYAANAEVLSLGITNPPSDNGKSIVEGAFISLIKSGQRFVHQVTVGGTFSGGSMNITIQPPLRRAMTGGDVVEVNPVIEGYVTGDEFSWTADHAKIYGLSFDIEEAA